MATNLLKNLGPGHGQTASSNQNVFQSYGKVLMNYLAAHMAAHRSCERNSALSLPRIPQSPAILASQISRDFWECSDGWLRKRGGGKDGKLLPSAPTKGGLSPSLAIKQCSFAGQTHILHTSQNTCCIPNTYISTRDHGFSAFFLYPTPCLTDCSADVPPAQLSTHLQPIPIDPLQTQLQGSSIL